jgi:hypothetical protein
MGWIRSKLRERRDEKEIVEIQGAKRKKEMGNGNLGQRWRGDGNGNGNEMEMEVDNMRRRS